MTPAELRNIWDAHSDRLTLIARSMTDVANTNDAEDAVQEAFVALAVQRELPDDPLAWLVRVVRNQLSQWRRSRGRRQRREHEHQHQSTAAPVWLSHPQRAVDRQLDGRAVTAALTQLPQDQRQVIVMHLWGEMTFEQIAVALGGSRSSVHRTYGRGLEQLKQRFNPVDPPDQNLLNPTHRDESDTVFPGR